MQHRADERERMGLEAGADAVMAWLAERRRIGGPVLVGVTGPVGAGKSAFAERVRARLGGEPTAVIVSTDSYLPDYDGLPPEERDRPERSDLARLAADLAELRAGRGAKVPVWSFEEHRRVGERAVGPARAVVCEGLHALHGQAAGLCDVRVYVEAAREARLGRVVAREAAGERGWTVEQAREHFETVAEPTFAERAAGYRRSAELVVINEAAE